MGTWVVSGVEMEEGMVTWVSMVVSLLGMISFILGSKEPF